MEVGGTCTLFISFIYIVSIGTMFLFQEKKISKLKMIFFFYYFSILNNFYNLIKFHPYQNIYFNYLFEKNANKLLR